MADRRSAAQGAIRQDAAHAVGSPSDPLDSSAAWNSVGYALIFSIGVFESVS